MDKFLETYSLPKLSEEETDNVDRPITRSKIESVIKKKKIRDFPGGPVAKNPPSNAGDRGLIPGQGTKIPHATGQLSLRVTTTELMYLNERAHVLQTTEPTCPGACAPELERENPHATTSEKPVCGNKRQSHAP